jgi:uncharacterized protein YkwD
MELNPNNYSAIRKNSTINGGVALTSNRMDKQLIQQLIENSANDVRYGISHNNKEKTQKRFIEEALETHNKYRVKHGVESLVHNAELTKIAQNYAECLAEKKSLQLSNNKYNEKQLGESLGFFYDNKVEYFPGNFFLK